MKSSSWQRLGTVLTVSALASIALPACTFVGGGVGAALDAESYEERLSSHVVQLEPDEPVVIVLRNGARVTGRYRATHGPTATDLDQYLIVSTDDGMVSVKMSEVSSVAVEDTGKGWLYGGLVGLAADVTFVVVSAIAVHNMKFTVFDENTRF